MPGVLMWIVFACAACATAPPAQTAAPPPAESPAAPAAAPTPAMTPAPAPQPLPPTRAKATSPPAESTPAAGALVGEETGTVTPPPSDAGRTPVAGTIVLPAGRSPDDMTPLPTGENRPPSQQGGAATALTAPSPAGKGSSGGLTLSVVVRPDTAHVGESVTVEIAAASSVAVVDAPLHLLYDPSLLLYLEASEGDYLTKDGVATVFLANGKSRPGDVAIGIGRTDRTRGAGGSGTLCRVRFEVLAPGTAKISIGQALAWAVDGSLVPVSTNAVEIRIP